jgi:hypothetical protein
MEGPWEGRRVGGREKGKEEKKDTEGLKPFLFWLGIPSRSLYYLIN